MREFRKSSFRIWVIGGGNDRRTAFKSQKAPCFDKNSSLLGPGEDKDLGKEVP